MGRGVGPHRTRRGQEGIKAEMPSVGMVVFHHIMWCNMGHLG